jgi:hypothetical protein
MIPHVVYNEASRRIRKGSSLEKTIIVVCLFIFFNWPVYQSSHRPSRQLYIRIPCPDNSLTDVHHPDAGRTQRTSIVLTEPGADTAAAELIVEAWMKADESLYVHS